MEVVKAIRVFKTLNDGDTFRSSVNDEIIFMKVEPAEGFNAVSITTGERYTFTEDTFVYPVKGKFVEE